MIESIFNWAIFLIAGLGWFGWFLVSSPVLFIVTRIVNHLIAVPWQNKGYPLRGSNALGGTRGFIACLCAAFGAMPLGMAIIILGLKASSPPFNRYEPPMHVSAETLLVIILLVIASPFVLGYLHNASRNMREAAQEYAYHYGTPQPPAEPDLNPPLFPEHPNATVLKQPCTPASYTLVARVCSPEELNVLGGPLPIPAVLQLLCDQSKDRGLSGEDLGRVDDGWVYWCVGNRGLLPTDRGLVDRRLHPFGAGRQCPGTPTPATSTWGRGTW